MIAIVVIAILVAAGGFYLILNLGGLSTCDSIQDPTTRSNCKLSNSIIEQDLSICEDIDGHTQKVDCFIYQAILRQDESICEMIEHETAELELREGCITGVAKVKEDVSLCEKLSESRADDCVLGIAIQTKNPDNCEQIENQLTKDNCIKQIAVIIKDNSLCDTIEDDFYKDACNSLT